MPGIGSGKDVMYGGAGIQQPRDSAGKWAGGQGVEWTGLTLMWDRTVEAAGLVIDRMRAGSERLAQTMEDYMKSNAPWEDRTGEARDKLQATAVHEDARTTIFLAHGADIAYGYFLENYTYNGVSYAIIRPTIEYFRDQAMSEVSR